MCGRWEGGREGVRVHALSRVATRERDVRTARVPDGELALHHAGDDALLGPELEPRLLHAAERVVHANDFAALRVRDVMKRADVKERDVLGRARPAYGAALFAIAAAFGTLTRARTEGA